MREEKEGHDITRRTILATAAFIPVAALTASAQTQTAESVFSPAQLKTLEAFVERLVPNDDNGPGAVECGVTTFMDRALGDYLSAEKPAFLESLDRVDVFARSAHGAALADLAPDVQDEVLTALENNMAAGFPNSRNYFNRVRRLTLEGMFCDPFYGGNKNFAGWDLIRYPGPRLAVTPDEQKMRQAIPPYRVSTYGPKYR